MEATVGDRLVVQSQHIDGPVRDGEILEVHGKHGAPPYLVRWSDTGRQSLVYPGPDSFVDHYQHAPVDAPRSASATR